MDEEQALMDLMYWLVVRVLMEATIEGYLAMFGVLPKRSASE